MSRYAVITDANASIGLGHVSRQIAIANHAQRRNIGVDMMSVSSIAGALCVKSGLQFHPLSNMDEAGHRMAAIGIKRAIIDVHESTFPSAAGLCASLERAVLMVSEVGKTFRPYGHHLIRLGSEIGEWNIEKQVDGLQGPVLVHAGRKWLPFRDEFLQSAQGCPRDDRTILIAHGGTDPHLLTARSLEALEHTRMTWNVLVLATTAFRDLDRVQRAAAASKHACRVIVDAEGVADWMRAATVAIINGGNIRYELCVTGTPFVALSFQPQQYVCTEQISSIGAGINLGVMNEVDDRALALAVEDLICDSDRLNRMREVMLRLFDGKGCDRVVDLVMGEFLNE
jgi:spore coat polysaccharide biosynthesis predicted glycosyltransferase SpsG